MSLRKSNFLKSAGANGVNFKGNLADFQHAARLYVDDTFRLAPKTKFLYYAVFNINPESIRKTGFQEKHKRELNYLVKKMDLPKFTLNSESVNQYNRKTTSYTKINYDPVTLVFHDDNNGVTNSLWSLYYSHYFNDRLNVPDVSSDTRPAAYRNTSVQKKDRFPFRYGLDSKSMTGDNPFFYSIQLITLTKKRFFSYMLCNPKITAWQHDTMDQSDSSGILQNTMTLAYDAVIYNSGKVSLGNPKDFAELHYDKIPSPISAQGTLSSNELGSAEINSPENAFVDLFQTNSFTGVGDDVATAKQIASYGFNNLTSYGENLETSLLNSLGGEAINAISGFANYDFGNIDSITGTPIVSLDNLYRPQLSADTESNYITTTQERAAAINNSFSNVSTPPLFTQDYVSDAYSLSLPSNLSGATASNSFGSYNTAATMIPSTSSLNNSSFTNVNRTTISQELISNNLITRIENSDPFA